MENIHATQAWTNEQLELIKKYGTTDVYVLQKGVDFVTDDETGTIIIGTVNGGLLDLREYTVVVPEGITKITGGDEYKWLIQANSLILPKTCTIIEKEAVYTKQLVLSEGMESFSTSDIQFNCDLHLPSTLTDLSLYYFDGNIYCNDKASKIVFSKHMGDINLHCPVNIKEINISSESCPNIYVYNTSAKVELNGFINVYGYTGSTAEGAVNLVNDESRKHGWTENICNFINIGSDCTPFLKKSTSTEAIISANRYYAFTDISSLAITLETASTTKLDEFMFSFVTPEVADNSFLEIISDEEIQWVKEPNIKPNYIYEVSIVNNVGVIAGVPNKEVSE
jgi:hypothetical protein